MVPASVALAPAPDLRRAVAVVEVVLFTAMVTLVKSPRPLSSARISRSGKLASRAAANSVAIAAGTGSETPTLIAATQPSPWNVAAAAPVRAPVKLATRPSRSTIASCRQSAKGYAAATSMSRTVSAG
jgi:hypothetical protein